MVLKLLYKAKQVLKFEFEKWTKYAAAEFSLLSSTSDICVKNLEIAFRFILVYFIQNFPILNPPF